MSSDWYDVPGAPGSGKPINLTKTLGSMLLGIIVVIVLLANWALGYTPNPLLGQKCSGMAAYCPPPPQPTWKPPIWAFIQTYPIFFGVLLGVSILLAVVGFVMARGTSGATTRADGRLALGRLFRWLPIIMLTLVALVALLLFP